MPFGHFDEADRGRLHPTAAAAPTLALPHARAATETVAHACHRYDLHAVVFHRRSKQQLRAGASSQLLSETLDQRNATLFTDHELSLSKRARARGGGQSSRRAR